MRSQGFGHEDNRHALWSSRYNTSHELYVLVRQMNAIRKRHAIGIAPMTLAGAAPDWIVICRGEPSSARSVWLLATNRGSSSANEPQSYCPQLMPPALADGFEWVDELSGQRALLSNGCLHAPDALPKVLVSKPIVGARADARANAVITVH